MKEYFCHRCCKIFSTDKTYSKSSYRICDTCMKPKYNRKGIKQDKSKIQELIDDYGVHPKIVKLKRQ